MTEKQWGEEESRPLRVPNARSSFHQESSLVAKGLDAGQSEELRPRMPSAIPAEETRPRSWGDKELPVSDPERGRRSVRGRDSGRPQVITQRTNDRGLTQACQGEVEMKTRLRRKLSGPGDPWGGQD